MTALPRAGHEIGSDHVTATPYDHGKRTTETQTTDFTSQQELVSHDEPYSKDESRYDIEAIEESRNTDGLGENNEKMETLKTENNDNSSATETVVDLNSKDSDRNITTDVN